MSCIFQKKRAGEKESLSREVYTACCEAEIKPLAYCNAPVDIDKIEALMAYGLRAAIANEHKHIFLVVQNDAVVPPTVNALRAELVLANEEKSKIIVDTFERSIGKDQGLGTLWRAPIVVLSEKEFWRSISANAAKDVRKLREIVGSTILLSNCFADSQRWSWPQEFKWLQILTETCGCCVLLQADTMVRFWELFGDFPKKLHSILPSSLQQRITESEGKYVSFCFDEKKPLCIDDFNELAARLTKEPSPRLVVLHTEEAAKCLEVALTSEKETVYLALSSDELHSKMELLKKEDAQNRVTLLSACGIPEKQGFFFAAGFVQLSSMSTLLRAAQLMDNGQTPVNLYAFDLRIPNMKISENDYRSSIPLREMIKKDKFPGSSLSDLLTEAVQIEMFLPPYDAREEELKRAEQTLCFKETASLFSKKT